MGRVIRSITGAPSPGKIAAQQQALLAQQRQLQLEAEERAEQRRREEEEQALRRAAAEYRARLSVSQGRRANRAATNTRETLNRLGLLG